MAPTYHIVEQGEHLSGIALKYGFHDYVTIWNHAENRELKQKRQNPNVLFPGDRLFIPEKEMKDYSRPTDERHKFKVRAKPLKLKLKLAKGYDEPIADTECELRIEFDNFALTSDSDGRIEHQVSKTAQAASLIIKDKLTIKNNEVPFDIEVPIKIGHLDPVEELSGQRARLANLGYYRGPFDEPEEKEFLSADEEFQCENGLKVDGICGAKTQVKLKEVHGC
jgi:Putative peptidoglycan binding domain